MNPETQADQLLAMLKSEGIECGIEAMSNSTSTVYLFVRRPTEIDPTDGEIMADETAKVRIADHANAHGADDSYALFIDVSPADFGCTIEDAAAELIEWVRDATPTYWSADA